MNCFCNRISSRYVRLCDCVHSLWRGLQVGRTIGFDELAGLRFIVSVCGSWIHLCISVYLVVFN